MPKKAKKQSCCKPTYRICMPKAPACEARSPAGLKTPVKGLTDTSGFICCRAAGHRGSHVACSPEFHNIVVWPQEKGAAHAKE